MQAEFQAMMDKEHISTMRNAFSLVELSIVLVILGLLTGGILAGQSLIRASELRSTVAEIDRYSASYYSFRDKYMAMPGDMTIASSFWGALDGGDGAGSDCFTLESTGTATCNGSGNGYIATPTGGIGVWAQGERFTFWQHLANAGLIEGSYTGRTDSTTDSFILTAGKNAPASRVSGSLWAINSTAADAGDVDQFAKGDGPFFTFRTTSNQTLSSLKPEELWSIDVKRDDGKPGLGIIMTHKRDSTKAPNCATTNSEATAEYNLTQTSVTCHARFFIR